MDFSDLWDFQDPQLSESRFRELLGRLEPCTGDFVEVQTQLARSLGLQRRFQDAQEVLDEAGKAGNMPARAQVLLLLERGRIWNSSGERERGLARPLFVSAWEMARESGQDGLAVDAAHMVAIAGSPGEALEWNERALELAEASTEPAARKWRASLHNNIGWTRHAAGDLRGALQAFERALEMRREMGDAGNMRFALWSVAKALRGLGRLEEALEIQESLGQELDAEGSSDGYVDEELGECLLEFGCPQEARPHFARAYALLSKDPWPPDPARLARMRELGEGSGGKS